MLEARKLSGPSGGTIMSKRTAWFRLWTAPTYAVWKTAVTLKLHGLLQEESCPLKSGADTFTKVCSSEIAWASLLIFSNKQDLKGALKPEEIAKVLNLETMDNSRN